MKKIILVSVATIALTLGACNNSSTGDKSKQADSTTATTSNAFDTTKLAAGAEFYQCSMDPEEISDKAGSCSKCGMYLEKVIKH